MKEFKVNKNISYALVFYIFAWLFFTAGSVFNLSKGNVSMWLLLLVLGILFIFICTVNIAIYPKIVYADKQNISLVMFYSKKKKTIPKDKIVTDHQKGIYILRYQTEKNIKKSYYIRERNIPEELKRILSKMAGK
ncbi:hypothetical protein [Brassicibacter mesophilus]|uniref:hypothetical protein n=1 Tax=Brassicibacter mesophilus TaxID=745119 RepID=UPI003D205E4C